MTNSAQSQPSPKADVEGVSAMLRRFEQRDASRPAKAATLVTDILCAFVRNLRDSRRSANMLE